MPPMLQAGPDKAAVRSVSYDQDMHISWEDVSSTLCSPLPNNFVTVSSCYHSLPSSYLLFTVLSLGSLFTIPFEIL